MMAQSREALPAVDIKRLHRESMSLCDEGDGALFQGNNVLAFERYRAALDLESKAARAVSLREEDEPSRWVLYYSAATLALMCELYDQARTLLEEALAGTPLPEDRQALLYLLAKAEHHEGIRRTSPRGRE